MSKIDINNKSKPPFEKDNLIELNISGMNHQGQGVGRYEGFAVFVSLAVPGDRVKVQIAEVKNSYAYGKVQEYLSISDYTTESKCFSYGECGGCHLQHYDYSQQLVFKEDTVRNSLQRIGKLQGVSVLPTIGMKNPYSYRNKAEYPVRFVDGVFQSGFFASSSNRLVALQHTCPLQHPLLEKTRKSLMDVCNQREVQKALVGAGLNQLVVRCGQNTGEVMVVLVVQKRLKDIGTALDQLMVTVPEIVSVYQRVVRKASDKKGSTNGHAKYELMEGKPCVRETINGLDFDISPGSFFQVNSVQAEILFSKTVGYADCKGMAIDAYCGTGSISLSLTKQSGRVIGIESFPDAVFDARHNAAINHISNVEFMLGDTGNALKNLEAEVPEAVVLDPPRAGCDSKALEAIALLNPEKIVYVSCNPATLARDLELLVSKGYSVLEAQPIDMFPQTYHVETVVLLEKK